MVADINIKQAVRNVRVLDMINKLFIKENEKTHFCRIYQKGNKLASTKWIFGKHDYEDEDIPKKYFTSLRKHLKDVEKKLKQKGYSETKFIPLVLQLFLDKLENPKIDLEYVVSDLVEEELQKTGNGFSNDYYLNQEKFRLNITFLTIDPHRAMQSIVYVLTKSEVFGNDLMSYGVIAMQDDADNYSILYPDYCEDTFVIS